MPTSPTDRLQAAFQDAASCPHLLTNVVLMETVPGGIETLPLRGWPREVVAALAGGHPGEDGGEVMIEGRPRRSLLFGPPEQRERFRALATEAADALTGTAERSVLPPYLEPPRRWTNA